MTQLSGYLLAAAVIFAVLAGWQAHAANQLRVALGEEKQRCETRFANFNTEAEQQKAQALEQLREEARVEKARLQQELYIQRQLLSQIRERTQQVISALESRLAEQEQEAPEIVVWLDMPIPSQLLP